MKRANPFRKNEDIYVTKKFITKKICIYMENRIAVYTTLS